MKNLNCKTSSENSESSCQRMKHLRVDVTSHLRTTVSSQQINENSSATKVLRMCWDTDTDQSYSDFSELVCYASSLRMTKRSVAGRVLTPLFSQSGYDTHENNLPDLMSTKD